MADDGHPDASGAGAPDEAAATFEDPALDGHRPVRALPTPARAVTVPRVRKLALTVHVLASVGWLGAVVVFLGLSVVGVTSDDPLTVRSVYIAMDATGRGVIVPLSMASLVTGLIQGLATPWGIFEHYWVVAKLVINLFASLVLLLYLQTLDELARTAFGLANRGDVGALQDLSPVVHAAGAVVLLVMATILSVFKPKGLTPLGLRHQRERRARATTAAAG